MPRYQLLPGGPDPELSGPASAGGGHGRRAAVRLRRRSAIYDASTGVGGDDEPACGEQWRRPDRVRVPPSRADHSTPGGYAGATSDGLCVARICDHDDVEPGIILVGGSSESLEHRD